MSQPNRETDFEITQRFHPKEPIGNQQIILENLRLQFADLARAINRNLRDSREKSLAITALEESAMWANKAVFTGVQ